MNLEISLLAVALALALILRPWRMLVGGALVSPLLGTLVILPWLWAIPRLHAMPLPLQLSGACAVTLMLGWPLAVLALSAVVLLSDLIAPATSEVLLAQLFWQGILPATLALGVGAALRRWVGNKVFVYILGRGFAGTIACTFAASVLAHWNGFSVANVSPGLSVVGHWLLAWGDGFATGMLAAIFVAYQPQWLATWSDTMYLKQRH